jgi:endonuclease/exonuclease/phosphatase family metal-dependent hydrolase
VHGLLRYGDTEFPYPSQSQPDTANPGTDNLNLALLNIRHAHLHKARWLKKVCGTYRIPLLALLETNLPGEHAKFPIPTRNNLYNNPDVTAKPGHEVGGNLLSTFFKMEDRVSKIEKLSNHILGAFKIDLGRQGELILVIVHIAPQLPERAHTEILARLHKIIEGVNRGNIILLGDFNARPGRDIPLEKNYPDGSQAARQRRFYAGLQQLAQTNRLTLVSAATEGPVHTYKPSRRTLDLVYVSNELAERGLILRVRIIPTPDSISDHHMVLLETNITSPIEINPTEPLTAGQGKHHAYPRYGLGRKQPPGRHQIIPTRGYSLAATGHG